MYVISAYPQKAIDTGIIVKPYNRELVSSVENDTIPTEIEARVRAMCNQARKVRSLAKKTFGSTLTGTFLVCKGRFFLSSAISLLLVLLDSFCPPANQPPLEDASPAVFSVSLSIKGTVSCWFW